MIENELTPSERMILDFIKFRTNNHLPYYGGNRDLATYIGIKASSAKVLVNGLVRKGYLEREDDGKHQRCLKLASKEYLPMTGCNMADLNKEGLRKERDKALSDYQKVVCSYDKLNDENIRLSEENEKLKQKASELEQQLADITQHLETEFIPDYQAKIDHIKDLEEKLSVFMGKV